MQVEHVELHRAVNDCCREAGDTGWASPQISRQVQKCWFFRGWRTHRLSMCASQRRQCADGHQGSRHPVDRQNALIGTWPRGLLARTRRLPSRAPHQAAKVSLRGLCEDSVSRCRGRRNWLRKRSVAAALCRHLVLKPLELWRGNVPDGTWRGKPAATSRPATFPAAREVRRYEEPRNPDQAHSPRKSPGAERCHIGLRTKL
jgi:hypothetical protein